MWLLKEVSVIVARRMLFKRNTFRCQLPQCKKKETNTEQCRQQSSKLTDRELSSISCTLMYMFARGLSFAFFFSHLNNKREDYGKTSHKFLKIVLMIPQIIMNRSIHILRKDVRAHDHTLTFVIKRKCEEQN